MTEDVTRPATLDDQAIRAEITRQINWYEAKGREMKSREYQLAFALVIGATTALRDLLEKLQALAEIERVKGEGR